MGQKDSRCHGQAGNRMFAGLGWGVVVIMMMMVRIEIATEKFVTHCQCVWALCFSTCAASFGPNSSPVR